MKNALLILSFLIGIQSFSQAIMRELGFNEAYSQSLMGNVVCIEDDSYFVYIKPSPTITYNVLVKVNSSGDVIWKKNINPMIYTEYDEFIAEYGEIYHMAELESGGIIMTGYGEGACDVGGIPPSYHVRKLDLNGEEIWRFSLEQFSESEYSFIWIQDFKVNGDEVYLQAEIDNVAKFFSLEWKQWRINFHF